MEDNPSNVFCVACGHPNDESAERCTNCGYELLGARDPFESGVILEGRYRIDAEVGRGGMGVVYQGSDLTLSRPVAIKAMLSSQADAGVLARFMHEARALASVEHPRLVPVYAVGQESGVYYMVMKFVNGTPLSQLIAQGQEVSEDTVVRMLTDVSGALEVLHSNELVHRDIKPGNLILDADGRFTVMDLGIAKSARDSVSDASAMAGTPRYMAPELFSNGAVDGRADLYALGIVAYQLLAGRAPFDGPTPMAILYEQAHVEPTPIRRLNRGISPGMAEVVGKLLQKSPEERFQTAAALERSVRGLSARGQSSVGRKYGVALLASALVVAGVWASASLWQTETVDEKKTTAPVIYDAAPPKVEPDAAAMDAAIVDAAPPRVVSIRLETKPRGALVTQGRTRLGATPLTLERVENSDSIRVQFKKDGYVTAARRIKFERDAVIRVALEEDFQLVE